MKLYESNPIAYNQIYYTLAYKYNFELESLNSNSKKIVYWQCDENKKHIWPSHVYLRGDIDKDSGCPYCNNEKTHGPRLIATEIVRSRQVSTLEPLIRYTFHCEECKSLWDINKIELPVVSSICINCEIEINPTLLTEQDNVTLIEEWAEDNILSANEVTIDYHRDVKWKCSTCEQFWTSTISSRLDNLKKCPYCSGKLPISDLNSFAAIYPEISLEWDYEKNTVSPSEVFLYDFRNFRWICKECGVSYSAKISKKVSAKDKVIICPNCSSDNPFSKQRYQDVLNEFYEYNVSSIDNMGLQSNHPVQWNCKQCGTVWMASLYERLYEHKDCICSIGRRVIPGVNSFKALYPDLVLKEWKYLSNALISDPDQILPTNSEDHFWVCVDCGSTYKTSPKKKLQDIQRNMKSCHYCKGLRMRYNSY